MFYLIDRYRYLLKSQYRSLYHRPSLFFSSLESLASDWEWLTLVESGWLFVVFGWIWLIK